MEQQKLGIETDDILSATWGLQAINAPPAWGMHGARGKGVLGFIRLKRVSVATNDARPCWQNNGGRLICSVFLLMLFDPLSYHFKDDWFINQAESDHSAHIILRT